MKLTNLLLIYNLQISIYYKIPVQQTIRKLCSHRPWETGEYSLFLSLLDILNS